MGYLQFEVLGFDREDARQGGRATRAIGGSRQADRPYDELIAARR